MKIPGLIDTPTIINEKGAKQSDTPYRFDLIPHLALFKEAEILGKGAKKYGDWNWIGIPINEQINHAIQHIYAYLAGDTSDDHLGNASCRVHFALELQERDKQNNQRKLDLGKELIISEKLEELIEDVIDTDAAVKALRENDGNMTLEELKIKLGINDKQAKKTRKKGRS